MDTLLERTKEYLAQVIGAFVSPRPWVGDIPAFLSTYQLFNVELFQRPFLLALHLHADRPVAAIEKHMTRLSEISGVPAILVVDSLSNYARHALIANRTAFIVPGRQLFVPNFAFDFSSESRNATHNNNVLREKLSPATQLILIGALLEAFHMPCSASQLESMIPYSKMTIGRAISELESLGIFKTEKNGRTRLTSFVSDNKKEMWKMSQPYIKTPVIKEFRVSEGELLSKLSFHEIGFVGSRHGVLNDMRLALAGESALSRYSKISSPRQPTYAVSAHEWSNHKVNLSVEPKTESGLPLLQIWAYDPLTLAKGECVDPISLIASLDDMATHDSRVADAISCILEELF